MALLLTVSIGAFAGLLSTGGLATGSGRETKNIVEQGWGYYLEIEDGKLDYVAVYYDSNTAAGVQAYAEAQRKENEQFFQNGAKEVKAASIVFKRALTWDEADAFVRAYGIYAAGYYSFGWPEDNPDDIYSMGIGVIRDGKTGLGFNDGYRASFDQKAKSIVGDQVVVRGIGAMQANFTREQYGAVSGDPDVYLVEMPAQIIKAKIQRGEIPALKDVQIDAVRLQVSGVVGPLYRNMVKTGIMK
jgi:hypothetical protein